MWLQRGGGGAHERARRRLRIAVAALTAAAVLIASTACEPKRARTRGTLDAHYGGCTAVREGPVCVLPKDGDVSVWIADVDAGSAGAVTSVTVDGRDVQARRTRAGAGTRIAVAVRDLDASFRDAVSSDSRAPHGATAMSSPSNAVAPKTRLVTDMR